MIERKPCPCCGKFVGDKDFYAKLDKMVEVLASEPAVTSGFRCAAYNAKISHRSTGRHVIGQAVDLRASTPAARGLLIKAAIVAGLVSFAVLPKGRGLHIDAGTVPWLGLE